MRHEFGAMVMLVAAAVGCGTDGDAAAATTAITRTAVATTTSHAADGEPTVAWRDDTTAALTYTGASGAPRTVLAALRPPPGRAPAAGRPVVVWSHGGADGKDSVVRVGDGWTRAFHEAGYLVVAIAHPGRDTSSRERLCDAVGVADCTQFKYLTWDRPNDAIAVFDWLEALAADGAPIDLDRLVYAGHSAGSVGVLGVAGMSGHVDADRQPPSDPRPAAFLAASPPGASTLGLDTGDVTAIDRPVLMLTGVGDVADGAVGDDRRATFGLLPRGGHALVWVDDPIARHTTFDLDLDACRRSGGTRQECRDLVRAIARVGVAWVDAALAGRSAAFEPGRLHPDIAVTTR